MKLMTLALAAAVAAFAPSTKAAAAGSATSAEHLFCEFEPRQATLRCWDSPDTEVYRDVAFDQAFKDGWKLMHAYSSGAAHYWVLERKQPAAGG